ncbi:EamA/RhaT family transporter [Arcticibacter sp. MXS-1]|uniref:EamA/RhaT family transporter n=1 Tax=Arcticibacter sp. MXS-1 TaxID=3341726 RepID=UPI0035A91E31
MIFVLLSVCCSVIVSVLLKLPRRYEINVPQAVVWNYPVAALLTYLIFNPQVPALHTPGLPFSIYILLAILLPSLFVILGLSVRYTGIVRTDLAQRLSLFIPLITSFLLFREPVSALKAAGIVLGLVAIVCSVPWQKGRKKAESKAALFYPLIVFAGMGLIDVFFKQLALNKSVPYTGSIFIVFVLAFAFSIVALLTAIVTGRQRFSFVNVIAGLVLGIFNFGNILFYMKAHKALPDNPSVVFSAMNIGVIGLGALVGMALFKERLSLLNKVALVIAVIAIVMISYSS